MPKVQVGEMRQRSYLQHAQIFSLPGLQIMQEDGTFASLLSVLLHCHVLFFRCFQQVHLFLHCLRVQSFPISLCRGGCGPQ